MSLNFGFSPVERDFNDTNLSSNQHRNSLIEVVVVDMTRPTKTLYQFNKDTPFTEEELKSIKRDSSTIAFDAFTPIGQVDQINKADKSITLTNGNTVIYNHLISVTGKQPTVISYEFLAGLYTLVEALRVSKTLEETLIPPYISKHTFDFQVTVYDDHDEKIGKLGARKLPNKTAKRSTVLVSELNKKLFEVQI